MLDVMLSHAADMNSFNLQHVTPMTPTLNTTSETVIGGNQYWTKSKFSSENQQQAKVSHLSSGVPDTINHKSAQNICQTLASTINILYPQPVYSRSPQTSSAVGLPAGDPSGLDSLVDTHQNVYVPCGPDGSLEGSNRLTSLLFDNESSSVSSYHPKPIGTKPISTRSSTDVGENSDNNEQQSLYPNKFPTILEFHKSAECCYKRQPTRSGPKTKRVTEKVIDPLSANPFGHEIRQKTIKYYKKDLVRYCICGEYEDQSGLLSQGRPNDCKGYEIHYSQKCQWKAYTDFYTKQTVLIRLCKCYKPHH